MFTYLIVMLIYIYHPKACMSLKLYFIEIVAVACKKNVNTAPPENQNYTYIIRIHAHYNYIHDTMADDWLHYNYNSDIDKREVPPLPLNPILCIYFRFIIIISDAMWVWKTTNKSHLYTTFRTVDTTRIRCVKIQQWQVKCRELFEESPSPLPCHTKTNTRLVFVEFRMQPGHFGMVLAHFDGTPLVRTTIWIWKIAWHSSWLSSCLFRWLEGNANKIDVYPLSPARFPHIHVTQNAEQQVTNETLLYFRIL